MHHIKAMVNFKHFNIVNLNSRQNTMLRCTWLPIVGEIWKHRNGVIFNQRKVYPEEIFDLAQVTTWAWMKHKIPSVKFSYSDWYLPLYEFKFSMIWNFLCILSLSGEQRTMSKLIPGPSGKKWNHEQNSLSMYHKSVHNICA